MPRRKKSQAQKNNYWPGRKSFAENEWNIKYSLGLCMMSIQFKPTVFVSFYNYRRDVRQLSFEWWKKLRC